MGTAIATGSIPSFWWVYFVGPTCGCALNALLFFFAPPHHEETGVFTPPLLAQYREELKAVREAQKTARNNAAGGSTAAHAHVHAA